MLEKNADERLQPASLTKLITAYIVLDALKSGSIKWDQLVRVEATDLAHVADDEASMRLRVGQVISVKELLTGLVVVSANDAAMVLAHTIAGSEGAFLAKMNDYAHHLSLRASHFATPSGITTQNHYTTARDIAELSLRLTEDFPIYLAFSAQREFSYGSFTKRNKNRLLIDPTIDGLKPDTPPARVTA
ncbi:hypothetical protein AWV80_06775 [Cupriavidus sp. UYMU48A]|nr:hypothetical protein AWV80_06775 [Cupriavidus sp. UYMU48A]